MGAKKKIFSAISTIVAMVVIIVSALAFAIFADDIQRSAYAKSFESYGVAATVSGNFYCGGKVSQMLSGENDKIVFNSYDEESSPALNPTEDIVLSSTSDYVIFEYIFKNNSDSVSFVTRLTNAAEINNMTVTYGYSYSKLTSYETINKQIIDNVPLIYGEDSTLYFYIKAKVENLNKASSLIGDFCFSLTAADVYELELYDGIDNSTAYVSLGLMPNSVNVPQKEGFAFKGYYTDMLGKGRQIFDENGNALNIWSSDSGDTLYAYFEEV